MQADGVTLKTPSARTQQRWDAFLTNADVPEAAAIFAEELKDSKNFMPDSLAEFHRAREAKERERDEREAAEWKRQEAEEEERKARAAEEREARNETFGRY